MALAFIAGVALASWISIPFWLLIELFLLGIFYVLIFFRHRKVVAFGFCLAALALGMWRVQTTQLPVAMPRIMPISPVDVIGKVLPSPQAELLSGILFGGRQDLSYELKKKMNLAGVRHITAVSGANIVLLAQILLCLGISFGLYRQWAVGGAAFLIWFYIFLIGWPASAVRAGIMASLLLIAAALGRSNRVQRTVVLAAAVMLAVDPSLLLFNLGFQLSFLATLGLIYLAPLLQNWLVLKVKFLRRANLAQILAVNLAAWLFTLPLAVYYFGYFSPTAIIANLLIVPVILPIMLLGFLLLLGSFICQPLVIFSTWLIILLLNYFLQVIDWFSPAVLFGWQLYFSKAILVICYLGLIFWIWRWRKSKTFI